MSGNTWQSKTISAKLLSALVMISIFPSDTPLDFDKSIPNTASKIFNVFF